MNQSLMSREGSIPIGLSLGCMPEPGTQLRLRGNSPQTQLELLLGEQAGSVGVQEETATVI